MSDRSGGNNDGCKNRKLFMDYNRFPDVSSIRGEKTV